MKNVFVNDDIFLSEGDYIIGGFETEQESDFMYADFYEALVQRLSKLIDDYLDRASNFNLKLNIENPKQVANEDLALIVYDNLGLVPNYNDKASVTETIFSSFQMQRWLDDLKENIKDYPEVQFGDLKGISNKATKVSKEQLYIAKECTQEATFEEFIEQLSTIES